jgi:hypothetical protein
MSNGKTMLIPENTGGLMTPASDRLGKVASFGLAAIATVALTINAFVLTFHSARLGAFLAAVLLLHVARFARVEFVREAVIYACFLGYMLLELFWTADRQLALNTIVPATSFLIILVLFTTLAVFHDLKSVLAGAMSGFIVGAALYTRSSGFPFRYPDDFSYNAIATMYLLGIIVTLLLASIARRRVVLLVLSALIAIHIVATTSIKTNLGILLGALTAVAIHFGRISQLLWHHALIILVAAVALGVAVASNDSAVETLQRGAERVAVGIQILQAREDVPGYTGFARRTRWLREGMRGWAGNPVFGHGVEAFRSRFGMTSHASHVDIAYNSGLIGLLLFYGVFASVLIRLRRARHGGFHNTRMIMLGGVACVVFISMAGTIHYNAFVAAFLGLSVGILKREPR